MLELPMPSAAGYLIPTVLAQTFQDFPNFHTDNENEMLVEDKPKQKSPKTRSLKVKTSIKAGGQEFNHNEALVRAASQARGLKVKTGVKAGGTEMNHNTVLVSVTR